MRLLPNRSLAPSWAPGSNKEEQRTERIQPAGCEERESERVVSASRRNQVAEAASDLGTKTCTHEVQRNEKHRHRDAANRARHQANIA